MANIEQRIRVIEERNSRVESDKAWETSKLRRFVLALVTYLVILYFLILINAPNPYLNALIPAGAYLIQQYSIPFFRRFWEKNFYKK